MSAIAEASGRFATLDILVNNAGILIEKPLLDTTAADFDAVLGVNLRGAFLVGRETLRHMVRQRSGRIINVASELAYLGRANTSVYCASKGGIISMTRSWARELPPTSLSMPSLPAPPTPPCWRLTPPRRDAGKGNRHSAPPHCAAGGNRQRRGVSCRTRSHLHHRARISPNGGAVMF